MVGHTDDKGPTGTMRPGANGGTMPPGGLDHSTGGTGEGGTLPQSPLPQQPSSNRHWNTGELILGQYEVVEVIGEGGMGIVYRCHDMVGGTDVAVKALPPEVSHSTAEMMEVRDNYELVSKLVHSNIANYKTLVMDKSTGDYYLVMEYVNGENMRDWMKRLRKEGGLSFQTVLPVLRQIAEALDFAHRQDVIHRDVKPDNVKIMAGNVVKVLDFGLAAQIRTSQAHVSKEAVARAGTNLYKSPEQWRASNRQGASTDQYSLAVVAYEALSGHVPFESDDMAVLKDAVLKEMPEPVEGLPAYANKALIAGLAKDASGRYETCVDFIRALGGEKVRPKSGKKGNQWIRFGIAAVLTLTILVGVVYGLKGMGRKGQLVEPQVKKPSIAEVMTPPLGKPEQPEAIQAELSFTEPKTPIVVDDEYYRLKGVLKEYNETIFTKHKDEWDRGQTVGRHMAGFEDNYDMAVGLVDRDDQKAYGFFKKAEEERKWLENNIPLRNQVQKVRQSAEEKRKEAQSQNAERYAHNDYEEATNLLKNADSQFDTGRFEEAWTGFIQAATAFEKVASSATRKHVDELVKSIENDIHNNRFEKVEKNLEELKPLSEGKYKEMKDHQEKAKTEWEVDNHLEKAKDAIKNEHWQEAFDKAQTVLKIKPDHEEAMALKQKAEENLHPVVSFETKADGQVVNAMFHIDGETRAYWTQDTKLDLEKGKTYRLSFSYENNGKKWVSDETVTPDKNGQQNYTVNLKKKLSFNGTVILPGDIELKLVRIEPGSFTNTEINKQITLTREYWIGKTEVTQGQYHAVMKDGVANEKGEQCDSQPSKFKGDDNLPVEYVSWYDAMAFCKELTRLERSSGRLPKGYEYSLPTEAQWEFAARGGKESKGYQYSGSNDLDSVAWYYENSGNSRLDEWNIEKLKMNDCRTHPVSSKKIENELGIYDMSGNVWEWCRDQYNHEWSYDSETLAGMKDGSNRVSRGGAWNDLAQFCRSSRRYFFDPLARSNYVGFRVALVPIP